MSESAGDLLPISEEQDGNIPVTEAIRLEAYRVHAAVMEHGDGYFEHKVAFGTALQGMRDRRLYLALGYKSFDTYCRTELDATRKWADDEISAASVMRESSTARWQITSKTQAKLLARLTPDQREVVLSDPAYADMGTRKLEEAVREANRAKKEAEQEKTARADAERRVALERQRAEMAERELTIRPMVEVPVDRPVPVQDPELAAELEQLRRELADKNRTIAQREADLAKAKKWREDDARDLQKLREQVDKDYTLEAGIRAKEQRTKELDALIQQMEANFEDGSRNRRGGAELTRTLFPLERVLWATAQDVSDLRKEGVGGPMDDGAVAKIRTKLREVANDLDSILKDRKTITLIPEVEVLNRE